MLDKSIKGLSDKRMTHAQDCLKSADQLLTSGDYKGSVNRSYYAIFHSMRAVLALDEVDMSKHSGIISEFRKRYIKTGIFSVKMSDDISHAFDTRVDCDYDDYYEISREEAEEQLASAKECLQTIDRYLKHK